MINPLPPSRNPADNGSMVGAMNVVLTKFLQGIDDMLPAQIVAYNRTTNMAQVQPLITIVNTDDTQLQRSPVMSVPVAQWGGGGFMVNFPCKANDLGFIKASDRDISIFKQAWGMSPPNTARKHSFSNSIFIPLALVNFVIAASDSENLVIQSLNGSIRFSMGAGTCISDEINYSQSVNSILDLQSTTKAFKLPRMTTAQKAAIPSPQQGFLVYDTTENGISVYNGSAWS